MRRPRRRRSATMWILAAHVARPGFSSRSTTAAEEEQMKGREVRDTMGSMTVPADAYYGAQTARALLNFPISGIRAHPEFIRALAAIKMAAARTNARSALLSRERAEAIERAAREVFDGALHDQFVVDVFNAGAGTSMHMNANEVIATRAREILGGDRGEDDLIHPNDHVNLGQSTNDVIPSAIRLAGLAGMLRVARGAEELAASFAGKAGEFDGIVKSGRTHLQDASPIRLGQEFGAYASCVTRAAARIRAARAGLCEIGIGGTAVGTGLNTSRECRVQMVLELAGLYGEDIRPAANLFEAMQSQAPVVDAMASVRGLALDLLRITNDLRLLSSGPRTGLAEIFLPAVQPGSSIMPGKVNPVICEATAMVCFQVIGCDATVAAASQAGQLELNVMMPVIAYDFLFALEIMGNALAILRERCIEGITADAGRCLSYAEDSVAIATILTPLIGYDKASAIVKNAIADGKGIRAALEDCGLLSESQVRSIFDLRRWTEPGLLGKDGPG
jgi:aspartate ammonia-lyase